MMFICMILKSLSKDCQAKKSFVVRWQIKKLLVMNMKMFLKFKIHFK